MANVNQCAIFDASNNELLGYNFDSLRNIEDIIGPLSGRILKSCESLAGKGLWIRHPNGTMKVSPDVSDEKIEEIKKYLIAPVESDTISEEYGKDYIEAYGEEYVLYVCIEECTELIKAITKLRREDLTAKDKSLYAPLLDNLAEEIADVYACLEFIRILYDIEGSEELEEGPWAVKSDPKRYLKHTFDNLTSVINICSNRLLHGGDGTTLGNTETYVQNVLRYARKAIQPIIELYDIKDEDIKFWVQFKQNRGRYRINQIKESKK